MITELELDQWIEEAPTEEEKEGRKEAKIQILEYIENKFTTLQNFLSADDRIKILKTFALNLINEQHAIPPEFEEVFTENFLSILSRS